MAYTHHDGVSVYGSGLAYGRKGSETPLLGAGFRADAGLTTFSGVMTTISTKLTNIVAGTATVKWAGAASDMSLGTSASGLPTVILINWSGNALDLATKYSNQSSNTSGAAASSQISWMVFGT
jgi:hypothetical protein